LLKSPIYVLFLPLVGVVEPSRNQIPLGLTLISILYTLLLQSQTTFSRLMSPSTAISVSCMPNWGGSKNSAALGSVKSLGTSACCPSEPQPQNSSGICPSYSDKNGIPPDTSTSRGVILSPSPFLYFLFIYYVFDLIY